MKKILLKYKIYIFIICLFLTLSLGALLLFVIVQDKKSELTKKEVLDFFVGKVAKWWIPDDVIFLEELPHTATGKLLKSKLRDEFKSHKIV